MRTRNFILIAVAVLAVLVGGGAYVALSGGDDDRRVGAITSSTAGGWLLELDGGNAGFLKSVDGCHVRAEVVLQQKSGGLKPAKAPGPVQYESCKLQFATGMGAPLYKWIADALAGNHAAKNIALIQTDANYNAIARLDLQNALIQSFTLPALDASNKNAAYFQLKIVPQSIQKGKGGGKVSTSTPQKAGGLLHSNFRLTIDGLPTTRVNKIDSWSVEAEIQEQTSGGGEKLHSLSARHSELSDLIIELPEVDAGDHELYLREAVMLGKPIAEKTAKLELLATDLVKVLATVDFTGVGLFAGELYGASETADATARRQFSFYVEDATLSVAAG